MTRTKSIDSNLDDLTLSMQKLTSDIETLNTRITSFAYEMVQLQNEIRDIQDMTRNNDNTTMFQS